MMAYTIKRSLVSITKACQIAGVSRRSIYYWLQDGKLAYVRTAGGSVRIFTDSLLVPADEDAAHVRGRQFRARLTGPNTSLAYRASQRTLSLEP